MTPSELRAAVLGVDDLKVELVPTPEWPALDGQIYVKRMSAFERERYLNSIRTMVSLPTDKSEAPEVKLALEAAGVKLVAFSACTAAGELLFTQEDVLELGKKNHETIEHCVDVSKQLNGLGRKAKEAAKNDSPSATT